MNKFINVLSVILVLSSSVFLSSANAAKIVNTVKDTNPTEMLINLAETDLALIDRLNDIALTDEKLLTQILKMAESDPVKLERLLNLEERNSDIFWMVANIYNAQSNEKTASSDKFQSSDMFQSEEELPMSTFGAINDGGGIIRN
jgi:hypothetical protein